MTQRQIGSATTRPCPTCGKQLELVTQPDNSVNTEVCADCYPQTVKAAVAKQVPTRVVGTDVQEVPKS
jgi:NMD protein affecting ribosome stability and mRNA decay